MRLVSSRTQLMIYGGLFPARVKPLESSIIHRTYITIFEATVSRFFGNVPDSPENKLNHVGIIAPSSKQLLSLRVPADVSVLTRGLQADMILQLASHYPERIYISREKSRYRRVINERKVEKTLA